MLSIVIPTLDRPESLNECLKSLNLQSCQSFQVIILEEKAPLAHVRNSGLSRARTPYISFIDDDVVLPPSWVSNVLSHLHRADVLGVSGPALTPKSLHKHRDLFRYPSIKKVHDRFFLSGEARPGHISKAGTFVTTEGGSKYEGQVQFLEACNMSFRTEVIKDIGGFDEEYKGLGEWSEPDMCFRLTRRMPGRLWFSPGVSLNHRVSQKGAYPSRRTIGTRLSNYQLFAQRWIPECKESTAYQLFLKGYYSWLNLNH